MNLQLMSKVLGEVAAERERQDRKWGDQSGNTDLVWSAVLTEETGEVAQAILKSQFEGGKTIADVRAELIQVAAVAVAHVEAIDTRGAMP